MSIPYEYIARRIPEPPDNDFMKMLAIIGIYLHIYFVVLFDLEEQRRVRGKSLEMNLVFIDDMVLIPLQILL